MKKYKFVILVLFLASVTTILVLCLRDKTFLQVKRDQLIIEKKETTPFPITNEVWPKDLTWHNGMEQKTFSSPKSTKGGTWNTSMLSFPPNFRQVGPDSNSGFRGFLDINDLSLTSIHPETRELYPQLAKSWAIHPDKKTVYFQLDPDARWDDGQAVTADDYIFRLKAMRSPSIIAPWYNQYYSTMLDEILKFDDHRIAVRLPKPIADLVSSCSLAPLPYHYYGKLRQIKKTYPISKAISYLKRDKKEIPKEFSDINEQHNSAIKNLDKGQEEPKEPKVEISVDDLEDNWVSKHNWSIQPRTGAYNIHSFIKGKEVVFKRNLDWWAKDKKFFENRYNVDFIKYRIIRNNNTVFEHFKQGNIDQFPLVLPNYWHSKAKYMPQVDKGYMQKIWFYNDMPQPSSQVSFNLDHKELKNLDLRLGIIYALNIQNMLDTVLFGDYERAETFHEGYGRYTNPKIRARRFDPNKAIQYFEKAGYTKIGADGIRTKPDGTRLSFKILYAAPHHTQRIISLQSEAQKLGLELALDHFDPTAVFKAMLSNQHEIAWNGWGQGARPRYRSTFHRENAHKNNRNNLSNIDNQALSDLIDEYRIGLDTETRIKQAHQIEQMLYDLAPVVPTYKVPYFRQALWRWVKYPEFIGTKSSELIMDELGLFWIDEELKTDILGKMNRNEIIYDIPPLIKNERYRQSTEAAQ